MKKQICKLISALFVVGILTTSASAASLCSNLTVGSTTLKFPITTTSIQSFDSKALLNKIISSQLKNIKFDFAWLQSGDITASTPSAGNPVVTTPVDTTPVETTPVETTPVETTPVETTPVETTPVVTPPATETTTGISAYEMEVINLVNEIRASNGLSQLKANAKLSEVARAKSQDMLTNKYFAHESPTYGSPFDMLRQFGVSYRTAGENIAYGYSTPAAVVDGWMNSQGHRENILKSDYTEIGIGYVSNGHYWTQLFIG